MEYVTKDKNSSGECITYDTTLKLYTYHVFCFMTYMYYASDYHLRTAYKRKLPVEYCQHIARKYQLAAIHIIHYSHPMAIKIWQYSTLFNHTLTTQPLA
jgi:hypothetical protein